MQPLTIPDVLKDEEDMKRQKLLGKISQNRMHEVEVKITNIHALLAEEIVRMMASPGEDVD